VDASPLLPTWETKAPLFCFPLVTAPWVLHLVPARKRDLLANSFFPFPSVSSMTQDSQPQLFFPAPPPEVVVQISVSTSPSVSASRSSSFFGPLFISGKCTRPRNSAFLLRDLVFPEETMIYALHLSLRGGLVTPLQCETPLRESANSAVVFCSCFFFCLHQ